MAAATPAKPISPTPRAPSGFSLKSDNRETGGFYFTDFRGTSTDPKGGVYYVSPDMKTITPVLPNLAQANGIALSPDGKCLWTTEFGRNLLHPARLSVVG
jgi:sugar lactone lactonase YvrE